MTAGCGRLHDQLFVIVDSVDCERIDVAAGRAENNKAAVLLRNIALKTQHIGQSDFRNPAAADRGDAGAADFLEDDGLAVGPDDLVDRRARDGEILSCDGNRQRWDDGQRQRHSEGHAGSDADAAVDLDDAADPLDVRANHVHADAAAGNGGHFLGGRKAGLEDQGELFARAQVRCLGLIDHASGNRLLEQLLAVDAAPVVLDIDQDLVAGLARRNAQDADFALAGLEALGGKLDAVIDRVADDVRQRVASVCMLAVNAP